jgi:peptidoglycan-associated lipoprotein
LLELAGGFRIVGDDGSNQKTASKPDGSFRFDLRRGVKYAMLASADGYFNARQEFESDTTEEDAEYNVDFILGAMFKAQIIENIFYDFDKAVLRDESKLALDSMVMLLKDHPNIVIEMASHTDRVGSAKYNQGLSQRRAQSVVDYLIENGIPKERLKPAGYGESRPKTVTKRIHSQYPQFEEGVTLTEEFIKGLSKEDQEAADQINRRTEFEVIDTSFEY